MIRLEELRIPEAAIHNAAAVLRLGYLVQGKHIPSFEDQLSRYLGVKHAVLVSSRTSALRPSLLALGIGRGDDVIVTGFTFPAAANVVERVGARADSWTSGRPTAARPIRKGWRCRLGNTFL